MRSAGRSCRVSTVSPAVGPTRADVAPPTPPLSKRGLAGQAWRLWRSDRVPLRPQDPHPAPMRILRCAQAGKTVGISEADHLSGSPRLAGGHPLGRDPKGGPPVGIQRAQPRRGPGAQPRVGVAGTGSAATEG
jgi:hypothetical protein